MEALEPIVTPEQACPYLAGRRAKLEWSYAPALGAADYEALMDLGHRKFGAFVFRPACEGCRACRPIRVPAATFSPDRSQRRAWRANQDLAVSFAPPSVDEERLALLSRYHEKQAREKGWPRDQHESERDYAASFVENPLPAVEIAIRENGALRAILLADLTPRVLSAVYHYHEPALGRRGLGTFAILHAIDLAGRLGKEHVYLGFLVAGCASMTYKARFRPCEVLGEDGVWRGPSIHER
ncbi:arginyltransferase [bacterium]|nr:arginyltransferase [bacterium]